MDDPISGYNYIATLSDGSEVYTYYLTGSWWVGVSDDELDVELEPACIVAWRRA